MTMSEKNCTLIFTGRIDEGKTLDEVHQKLADVFKTDIERIRRMFSGKRSIIKKNADRDTCLKMQKLVRDAGAICVIESEDDVMEETMAAQAPPASPAPVAPGPAEAPAPKANPYAAPQSQLKAASGPETAGFTDPQKRPAGNGATWVMSGIALFLKRPFTWIGIFVVYMLISIVMQIIPLLGPLAQNLLNPVFGGGLMMGARDLEESDELSFGCLFQGFKGNFGQLILVGLLFLCAIVACVMVGVVIFGVSIGFNFSNFQNEIANGAPPVLLMLILGLVVIALTIPMIMAFWFAPALVALNGKTAFEALGLSFKACMRNMMSFLVYSLVGLAVGIGVFLIMGLITAIFGGFGRSGGGTVITVIVFGFLFLSIMPVGMLTVYTSYRDIFYKE